MSNSMPSDHSLLTTLIFYYHLKKNAAESHQMLVEAYGGNSLSRAQCYRWFEKFQNGDFDVRNTRSVADRQKKLKMLNCKQLDEDDGQKQEHLAVQLNVDQSTVFRRLKAMGKIINVRRWVPHQLTDRLQENRNIVCKILLARYKRKSYLHRIVTGDEKWIYFENQKSNRSCVDPGQPSKSTNDYVNIQNCHIWSEANPQVYVKTPLHPEKLTVWCALWAGGINGPYFFKNDEGHNVTVNGDRYRAMITNIFIPELNNHDVH
ncbi:mariner Mos1 transposase [Trichonephila clavipes]|nr:mariner Mos1 transposase [Trichonephila clavipes]